MFVHMYHMQDCYIVSYAAICLSGGGRPFSLFNTLHFRLSTILICLCIKNNLYLYRINSLFFVQKKKKSFMNIN